MAHITRTDELVPLDWSHCNADTRGMTNSDRLRTNGTSSIGGGGWAYCPHCDCLTSVFDAEWGTVITCTVCDEAFTAERP